MSSCHHRSGQRPCKSNHLQYKNIGDFQTEALLCIAAMAHSTNDVNTMSLSYKPGSTTPSVSEPDGAKGGSPRIRSKGFLEKPMGWVPAAKLYNQQTDQAAQLLSLPPSVWRNSNLKPQVPGLGPSSNSGTLEVGHLNLERSHVPREFCPV